jgi:GT2 family glycosyltransferase
MKDLVSVIIVTRNRKKEFLLSLNSILASTYKPIEVIVIDNKSDFDIAKIFPQSIKKKITLIKSDKNLGAAGGRNLGATYAKGEYLLFFDDDVIADKKMVEELTTVLREKKNAVITSPKIYDLKKRKTIQAVGHWVNMITGRIGGWGVYEKDTGQYENILKVPMAGGVLLIKKSFFKKAHGFDEVFFIPYEDSDLTYQATRKGYDVLFVPKAICFHPSKKIVMPELVQSLGITSPERAYRTLRNKIILIRKNGKWYEVVLFMCIFVPIYFVVHSMMILSVREFKTAWYYWKGTASGLLYVIAGPKGAKLI